MFCSNCGKKIEETDCSFCPECGCNLNVASYKVPAKSPNGTLILVFGILGIAVLRILGIVALIMAINEEKLYPGDSNVKIGKICGFISIGLMAFGLAIAFFIIIIYAGFFATLISSGAFNL